MNKKIFFFAVVLIIFFVLGMLFGLIIKQKQIVETSTNSNSLGFELPDGWKMEFGDSTNCYNINVTYKGEYSGSTEDYINQVLYHNKLKGEIVNIDTFKFNHPDIVDLGQQGVGNFNTIYLKTSGNGIYLVEVNSMISESESKDGIERDCFDLQPAVSTIINKLVK